MTTSSRARDGVRPTPRAYRRLSESPLWAAQRRFYERAGPDAWAASVVPHHVTSNVALATAFARLASGFARDAPSSEPLYILEIGAGSGRFAFLFLRALAALPASAPVRYVITDVAEATIEAWRSHEALRPYLRAGRLDVARFDAERDDRITLECTRRTIAPDTKVARLVVIANYVFSSLRQDAFDVKAGRRYHALSTTTPARTLSHAFVRWRRGPPTTATPYACDIIDRVLRDAIPARTDGRFLFPIGALQCLERVRGLGHDVLVLVADRGTGEAGGGVSGAPDLGMRWHGAPSLPVALQALRAWTSQRAGLSLRPRAPHRHVHVAAFALGRRQRRWTSTRKAYERALADGGPDALYAERRRLATGRPLDLAGLRALIQRCGPDPRAIAECVRPLWPHLDAPDASLRRELRDAVLAAWPNDFHAGDSDDIAFHLGLVLYQVGAPADARRLFAVSLRRHGEDAASRWNLGLCQLALGCPYAAAAAFRRARLLARGFNPAGLATVKSDA